MSTSFASLGVPSEIAEYLAAQGIKEPFEIQKATIPDGLEGRDICGRAPTGSGKTLAFGIPLVVEIERGTPRKPRGLVLAPTRELADQICDELFPLAKIMDRSIRAVYGGVGYEPQRKALRKGVDILIACPGRLADLIQQGDCDLSDVDYVIIDEADRMADMGFLPEVKRLLNATSNKRQTVLFSATLDGQVKALTDGYQLEPVRHEVGPARPNIHAMTHLFWSAERPERVELTANAIKAMGQTIVFTRTRHGADRVAKQLNRQGVEAVPIHGGRSQGQRTRALEAFSSWKCDALVATDVAARGIHVDDVACVVHFDPPEDDATYVHRSGRTARAGASGTVISLVGKEHRKQVSAIQRALKLDMPVTAPTELDSSDRPARPAKTASSSSNGDGSKPKAQNGGHRKGGGKSGGGGSNHRGGGGGASSKRRRSRNGSAQGSGGSHGQGQGQGNGSKKSNGAKKNGAKNGSGGGGGGGRRSSAANGGGASKPSGAGRRRR